jgi:prepilin-type N-terminal cleavage/methylation domain-containing protein
MRGSRWSRSDSGMSMIETLVAIVLFGLVAAAATGMLLTGIRSSDSQQLRAGAASVASSQIEADRHTAVNAFTSLTPPGTANYNYTVKGVDYSVARLTEWVPKADATNACDSAANGQGGNNGVEPVLEITETVTWPHMDGASPVVNQTTLTPPVGTYSSTTGAIDVSLDDSGNAPLGNVPVTFTNLTGGGSEVIDTDSRGCAFAAYLTAGSSYQVTVSEAGYVDNNENTVGVSTCESGGSVAVTSGNVVSCPILYDRGVTVNWQYASGCSYGPGTGVALTAAQCPTPAQLTSSGAVTVGNAGLSATNQYAGEFTPVVSGSTLLYPYSSYTIWAGHCTTSKPLSPPTTLTAKPSPVTPNPVMVPLYGLNVSVSNSNLYPITSVTAKELVSTTNVCYPTTAGGSTYTLTAPANTASANSFSAVPAGVYTVSVTYTKSGTPTTKSTTVTVSYNGSGSPATGGTTGTLTLS